MITHIIFDLDGTLYDQPSVVRTYLQQFSQRHNLDFQAVEQAYREAYNTIRATNKQYPSISAFFQAVDQTFITAYPQLTPQQKYLDELQHLAAEAKKEILLNIQPRAGVTEFLTNVKKQNIKIVVFSGGHAIHQHISLEQIDVEETRAFKQAQLQKLQLDNYIDEVIPASMFGGYKPEKKVFEQLLEHLHCSADACIMIGNSEHDMAAQQVGIKTILIGEAYNHFRWKPNRVVKDFCELNKVITEILCTHHEL